MVIRIRSLLTIKGKPWRIISRRVAGIPILWAPAYSRPIQGDGHRGKGQGRGVRSRE